MEPRYLSDITAINRTIPEFNKYLNAAFHVPLLDPDRMLEDKSCVKIMHGNWEAFQWPNGHRRGVYFIFGREMIVQEKNGLYIGKASFSSKIGARLDSHLRPHKDNDWFVMNYGNEKYVLDYMATINLDSLGLSFMAPALEEYLITKLSGHINLINGTGN